MGLRDLVLFAIVAVLAVVALRRPWIGAVAFAWLSLMNPHRFTWGAAYDFPVAQTIVIATLLGMLFTRDERSWKNAPEVWLLVCFVVWMSLTTAFALEETSAVAMWLRVVKIQFMVLVTLVLINSRRQIEVLVLVITCSVAAYGAKGGLFTITSGGNYRVFGPPDSFIEENNSLALALVMTVPLLVHLYQQATRRWMRWALLGVVGLCVASILGSYSRGALLAVAAMSAMLWIRSSNKIVIGALMLTGVLVLIPFMPAHWESRMRSIADYEVDASAMGRINVWKTATNIANDRPLGAGFEYYGPRVFARYAPNPEDIHSAHSIYFQPLGEHGWIGLVLFLLMWFFAWRTSARIRALSRDSPDLRWAFSLASMIQVSLVGYFAGGAFLNLGYWDFPYYLLIVLVLTKHVIARESARTVPEGPSISATDSPHEGAHITG